LAAGQTKVESFTITLNDQNGGVITRTIDVTITGTNDAPVVSATDVTGAVTEQGTPAGDLTDSGSITFTDVDLSDVHLVSAAGSVLGALTAVKDTDTTGTGTGGQLTWTYTVPAAAVEYLAAGQTKVESFTITLKDQNGGVITRTIDVTITGTNDAPVVSATDVAGAVTEQDTPAGELTDSGSITFADVDLSDVHLVSAAGTPIGSVLGALTAVKDSDTTGTGAGGQLTWTYTVPAAAVEYLAAGQTKVERFTITLNDQNGGVITRTIDVTITGTNDAPVISSDGGGETATIFVAENTTAVTTVQANDVDGPSISYSILTDAESPDHAKFVIDQNTGALSFVTAPNFESPASAEGSNVYTVQVKAADGAGGFDVQTIIVTVTDVEEAPVAIDDSIAGATEDSTLAIASSTLLANDAYGDGDGLIVSSVSGTSAKGATVTLSGTNITYDPTQVAVLQALAAGKTTTDTFTYTVSNGHGGTDTATVTLTVAGVNDAPVVQGGTSTKEAQLANNNGVAVFDKGFFFGNDKLTVSDPDGDLFGIAITGVDNGSAGGSWEYWIGGGEWVAINLAAGKALVLSADAKVRFNGSGSGDTEHLTFVAWDGTDGSTSGSPIAMPSTTGGATAFSSGVYSVGAKNDAPVNNTGLFTVVEDQFNGTMELSTSATSGDDVIFSTVHDDILKGGAGADQFVFAKHMGNDTIADFLPGQDKIDLLTNLPFAPDKEASFNSWLNSSAVAQAGADTLIQFEGHNSILLSNVAKANLHMSDFILHPGGSGNN
jgi:VCBS repeat-containing protein